MMDYVTFETAAKLKDAGFPQPEILDFGQMFYRQNQARIADNKDAFPLWEKEFFAPRVTDIMMQLPEGCQLQMETQHGEPNPIWYVFPPIDWVYEKEGKYIGPEGNENPAEAAAQMWLKLNQK